MGPYSKMAYVIEGTKYPVVYIANYRVGSTAMAATLLDLGATQINHHHGLPSKDIPNALYVQTVRNHFDVFVSMWYKIGQRCSLQELIDRVLSGGDPYLKSDGFYNRFPCNYVLRYETLQHEFDVLCINAGLPVRKLKHDPSPRPQDAIYESILTCSQKKQIYNHYKTEMDFYGYWQEN